MRPILPILFGLTLIAVSAAQTNPVPRVQNPHSTPTVTGVLGDPRVPVFVTPQQMCDPNDLPDAMARAFRDSTGTVHLVAAATDLYQSLGPTLESAIHTCDAGYHSANDGNPADYDDTVWIDSFYTFDGKRVAGLSHTEYHGWSFPGECHTQNIFLCEFDSDTFHISYDGGYHFDQSKAPANLVAGLPFKYEIDRGPMGYSVDTNIIEWNGWFYAMVTDDGSWPPGCSGQTGPNRCLSLEGGAPIRTQDVFDPSSWRGWSGSDFSVQFVDPYTGPVKRPEEHVYTPVPYMTFVTSINVYQPANIVVATIFNGYDNEYGPEGLYLTTSTDLVNWTTPTLVITLAKLLDQEPTGNWQYAYFTLLDPDAPDMNFSIIGDRPYLYYVRLNNDSYLGRTLFRQPIQLSINPSQ